MVMPALIQLAVIPYFHGILIGSQLLATVFHTLYWDRVTFAAFAAFATFATFATFAAFAAFAAFTPAFAATVATFAVGMASIKISPMTKVSISVTSHARLTHAQLVELYSYYCWRSEQKPGYPGTRVKL
jgi:hypothetical protein